MHVTMRLAGLVLVASLLAWHYEKVAAAIRWIFYLLSLPMTFSLTFKLEVLHIVFVVLLLAVLVYLALHYRVHKRYSQLRIAPAQQAPPFELHPAEPEILIETEPEDVLGTFLASIRIFGYLERDVYQELARSLQEKRLDAGDRMVPKGDFYVVVEGTVQLRMPYIKPTSILTEALSSLEGSVDETESVLTEVGPGGLISSLFDVLAIFANSKPREGPEVTAVALTDCRLMVIPESALSSMAIKHPKVSAHIVQVIMSRFQRVTFLTLQQYLGLTREAMYIEKSLNEHAMLESDPPNVEKLFNWPDKGPHRLSELMTQMGRETRESVQRETFNYFKKIFHIQVDALGKDGSGWDLMSLRVALPDTFLVRQGDRNPGLYILLKGSLAVSSQSQKTEEERSLQEVIRPGSLVGSMAAFMGQHSLVTITAKEESLVAFIGKRQLEWIIDRYPQVILNLAGRLIERLSPMVRAIDLCLEWMHLNAGQIMCRQDEPADHIYIVLHGRVRCIHDDPDDLTIINEYGPGDSIGEQEMLLESAWPGTFHAIRDTEIAGMPRILFNALSLIHPEISLNISRILAKKSQAALKESDLFSRQTNLRTVAILPVDPHMHGIALEFAQRLHGELFAMDSSLLLDSSIVVDLLGKHAFSAIGKLKLLEWLNQIEEEHRIVIYLADSVVQSTWTRRCLRQADCILLIADAEADPSVGAYERLLLGSHSSAARKELVLVHGKTSCATGLTRSWLNNRVWIMNHHHVCMAGDKQRDEESTSPRLWKVLHDQMKKYGIAEFGGAGELVRDFWGSTRRRPTLAAIVATASNDDFGRLSRHLLGRSIGLVLGGGGARGLSHIGIIQALVEAGVPVDTIGGTSIGAFIGALYSRDVDYYAAQAFAKVLCQRMTSVWRQLLDLTYPITSWFTGHAFNRTLWKIFGDRQIEDLWLPFFCMTTDVAHSKMITHRTGHVWRFVRASMSLCGFLPPLCDRGALLVDGGYLNNVPVDVMMANDHSTTTVIAIDVGAEDETNLFDYGDTLSGFWLLLQRLFGRNLLIPTLTELQSRLAYVGCNDKLEAVKLAAATTAHVLYLRPPVQRFGVMDFAHHVRLISIGYEYGRGVVEEWRTDGTLKRLLGFRERVESPTLYPKWTTEELYEYTPSNSTDRRHVRRRSL
ncbi:Lysophospholipase NTE1 [Paramicrosporidium saccamoebae]|uniref:Lysophospholipase NTE1 n=1 Tax=Paramicrosporidium saccamoebae TaxID=1246581 RepID=A0A2H9TJ12_9FUNG|nr:Lysophospholipase NTE1 [Paramicrosporidium saccamoebae]